jgi:hypothetical protein
MLKSVREEVKGWIRVEVRSRTWWEGARGGADSINTLEEAMTD